jgi:hypothetical protein
MLRFNLQDFASFIQINIVTNLAIFLMFKRNIDRLCGLVVRVPGYRTTGQGSIPGAIGFSE